MSDLSALFIPKPAALKKNCRSIEGTRRPLSHQKTGRHDTIISECRSDDDRRYPVTGRRSTVRRSQQPDRYLVERHSRYVMLVKVARQDTETVINALIKNARRLPQELYKSLMIGRDAEDEVTLATA